MSLEFAGFGKQRCEVRSVKVYLRGFLDADQSTERGEKVDDTSGLAHNTSSGDSALPVKNAGDAMPAFELRSFLGTKFSVTLRSVAAVVGGVDDDGVL